MSIKPQPAITLAFAVGALSACSSVPDRATQRIGEAALQFADGSPAGVVRLETVDDRLGLAVMVSDVNAGEHGFHLHTTGSCKAPDFKSAGGHLNPAGNEHGSLNPRGEHLGDLPNLVVGASRTTSTEIDLGPVSETLIDTIFDADGTAVVIHAEADDYRTDPAGDAGSRIACGVFSRAR